MYEDATQVGAGLAVKLRVRYGEKLWRVLMYIIKDENGEIMRTVHRQEEARQIVQHRNGWTFKCVRKPVRKIDLSMLGEALF